MPNCKICGKPVVAANVFHSACWESEANKVAEKFCDEYCRFPREALDEDFLHEVVCSECPMARLLNLGI